MEEGRAQAAPALEDEEELEQQSAIVYIDSITRNVSHRAHEVFIEGKKTTTSGHVTCVPANLKEGKRWRKAEFLKKFGAKICRDREEFNRFLRRGDVQKINDLLIETEPFLQTEGFYYSIVVLYLFSKLCRMRQS